MIVEWANVHLQGGTSPLVGPGDKLVLNAKPEGTTTTTTTTTTTAKPTADGDGSSESSSSEEEKDDDDLKRRQFTFQAILHKNGDIVFAYKQVPIVIERIEDAEHPVKVGLSDAYIIDRTIFCKWKLARGSTNRFF